MSTCQPCPAPSYLVAVTCIYHLINIKNIYLQEDDLRFWPPSDMSGPILLKAAMTLLSGKMIQSRRMGGDNQYVRLRPSTVCMDGFPPMCASSKCLVSEDVTTMHAKTSVRPWHPGTLPCSSSRSSLIYHLTSSACYLTYTVLAGTYHKAYRI